MSDLSLEQKLIAVNAVLLLAVAGFAVVLLTQDREVIQDPPLGLIESRLANIAQTAGAETGPREGDPYANFGTAPVFKTLIPMPTPTPTPPPTPVPPPNLAQAISTWRVSAVAKSIIIMRDDRTKDEWIINTNNPDELIQTAEVNGETLEVKIDNVDQTNFAVTFVYDTKGPRQEVTKGMFDE